MDLEPYLSGAYQEHGYFGHDFFIKKIMNPIQNTSLLDLQLLTECLYKFIKYNKCKSNLKSCQIELKSVFYHWRSHAQVPWNLINDSEKMGTLSSTMIFSWESAYQETFHKEPTKNTQLIYKLATSSISVPFSYWIPNQSFP